MQHSLIPACFFPSMVLFLDDGNDFLLNVMLQLDERVAYRLFDMPMEALDFISHYRCEFDLFKRHCMSEYTEAKNVSNQTVLLGLAALHAEVYNPYRFSEISVVVVDFSSRGMDGLEFCRRIENSNIKKILLIEREHEMLATLALQEGLIDCFLYKKDKEVIDGIKKQVDALQLQYFLGMSEMVERILPAPFPNCLRDKKFEELFVQLCSQKSIIEYYLIEYSGSFLMLDEDAKVNVLILKQEQDIRDYYDYARDHGASETLLEELARGEKMPSLWLSTEVNCSWSDWLEGLVPSQRFIGNETYVYAYVPQHALFAFRQKKILSYHRYLDELDAEELVLL
jgi:CheY-like chemotaxis protein